ncbi:MAG: ATP-binding protein [Bacteroidetes bacterium]|nr:ATP-binding protein [Bacteroidota bacterium]
MKKLKVSHFGQLRDAEVAFGDLTVLVGPQATGKSIFMQLVKLLIDMSSIKAEFSRFSIGWGEDVGHFLDLYFGEGMSKLYDSKRTIIVPDGKKLSIESLLRRHAAKAHGNDEVFLIPAQRVLSLREGLTRPFTDYRSGDPFAVREFSERLHRLVQMEFSKKDELFPVSNKLKKQYRDLIAEHIFGDFGLKTDPERFEKRMVLQNASGTSSLPYLVWSAGQREFVPLLLGFYWLMTPGAVSRRDMLKYVLIEEPEMGLHPNAISVVMLLVLELLNRGYKVCLSTHSPHVLDIVWGIQTIRKFGGGADDVLNIFGASRNPGMRQVANTALKSRMAVAYFTREGRTIDITNLDPSAETAAEAGWGGLTEFSGRVSEIVSGVVANHS